MKKNRLIKSVGLFLLLGFFVYLFVGYLKHRPIDYHNQRLSSAISNATQVKLSLTPQLGSDGIFIERTPAITLTDRTEIDHLLSHFMLSWHQRASELFHECGGHIKIAIVMPDTSEFLIPYDHGKFIYPIHGSKYSSGYVNLPKNTCSELNRYFQALGYSLKELGISDSP